MAALRLHVLDRLAKDEPKTRSCNLAAASEITALLEDRFEILIQSEHNDAFPDLGIDIGKETSCLGAGDFVYLLTELLPPLRDQGLPQPPNHLDSLRGLGQLPFGRRQNAFQADQDDVFDNEGSYVLGPPAHEFLLELDDSVANRAFHFAFTPTFFHEPYITHGDTQKTYPVWA